VTPLELRILTGVRAGRTQTFQQTLISIGRDAGSDLRFDPARDLDVSAAHAEIRGGPGGYTIADKQSTNGTFVNGVRLTGSAPHPLHDGDVIAFGADGPTVKVGLTAARLPTAQRVAMAVRDQTRGLRVAALGLVIVVGGLAAAGFWAGHRATSERDAEIARLIAANESTSRQLSAALARAGDTSLVTALLQRTDSLLTAAQAAHTKSATASVRQSLRRNQTLQEAFGAMDLPAIHDANDSAIVLIASQIGPQAYEATGFCVRPSGLIVTNRHVVSDSSGRASELAVKFADTPEWRHAHVVRLSDDSTTDLALIQVDEPGTFPIVSGIAASVDVRVGSPIATLGFPLGTEMPMGSSGATLVPRTSLTIGSVSKLVSGLVQIDAFASHGSSGSPVFDAHGHVIGVVWGGAPGTAGRIVFAAPADQLTALLAAQP